MLLSFRNVLHKLHKLSEALGKELVVKMFVQSSADRYALQTAPWNLPSPHLPPAHAHNVTAEPLKGSTSEWRPRYPPALPSPHRQVGLP